VHAARGLGRVSGRGFGRASGRRGGLGSLVVSLVGASGAWWGPGGRRDGGVPIRGSTSGPEGAKKLVREKGPRTSYEKNTTCYEANKGLVLPAYLLISMALRSGGVLYLTRQMKEIG
jgi:hypothetical protein